MKTSYAILGIIFCFIACLATPSAIIYAIYLWGSESVPMASAAWGGAKLWVTMVIFVIPGLGFTFAAK